MFSPYILLLAIFLNIKAIYASQFDGSSSRNIACNDCSNSYITKMIDYSIGIINKWTNSRKTYDLVVQTLLRKYGISFSENQDNYIFKAHIPKMVEQCDIGLVVDQILQEEGCLKPECNIMFQDFVFNKSVEALTKSFTTALKSLIKFATEKLDTRNHPNCDSKLDEYTVLYNAEKLYDANVILIANWLIKLSGTLNDDVFLYNYVINIKTEDKYYIYTINYAKKIFNKDIDVPSYDPKPDFIEYCQELRKLSFKELSENETTNKFLSWACVNNKTKLVKCIDENKEYFNVVFDVIREKRPMRTTIFFYARHNFLLNSYYETVKFAFKSPVENQKLLQTLSFDTEIDKIMYPITIFDFLFSPDDITDALVYKEAIDREVNTLVFAKKYAELCFVYKRLCKISKILQKHPNITGDHKNCYLDFSKTKQNILECLNFSCLSNCGKINEKPTDLIIDLASNTLSLTRLIDNAYSQEAEMMNRLATLSQTEFRKEVESLHKSKKLFQLQQVYNLIGHSINNINLKLKNTLFHPTKGVDGLKHLENELKIMRYELGSQNTTNASAQSFKGGSKDYQTMIQELQNKVEIRRMWLFEARIDACISLYFAWNKVKTFLEDLKSHKIDY